MKNLPHIIDKVYREPWLITPEKHKAIQQALAKHLEFGGQEMDGEEEEVVKNAVEGGVAIIPVHGIIGKHLSLMETMCGGCDIDNICVMIDAAVANQNVETILFNFNSPGGTSTGIPELGRKIAAIKKPTIGFTDSLCCSAAYWLASQCSEFFCTESSCVGSIGVYYAWLDESQAMENAGLKMNTIVAGKYKLAGASFQPLNDEDRARFQADIDKLHADFKSAVTRFRQIPESAMQGQCFDGEEAFKNGLVTDVVESVDEILDE